MGKIVKIIGMMVAALALLSGCGGDNKKEQAKKEPTPVKVIKVEVRDVPIFMEWSGQVVAKNSVDVQARVEGYLKERLFKEGALVKEGELLYRIDPQPFEEDLRQAQADLESAKAELVNADADLKRYAELMKQEVISRSHFDSVKTNQETLSANVKRAQAAVQNAKINLGYTKVMAPISGKIGESNYDVGALVGPPSNSLLTKISARDEMYVKFALSETQYLKFAKAYKNKTTTEIDNARVIQLILSDGTKYPYDGKLDMSDPELDSKTGTLGIRLLFPNPDNLLIPGQFATVRARVTTENGALVIPQKLVTDVQGSKNVLIVEDGVVKNKTVTLGSSDGVLVVVKTGLNEGDLVVAENIQKLRPGTPAKTEVVPYPDTTKNAGMTSQDNTTAGADQAKEE